MCPAMQFMGVPNALVPPDIPPGHREVNSGANVSTNIHSKSISSGTDKEGGHLRNDGHAGRDLRVGVGAEVAHNVLGGEATLERPKH